MSLLGKRKRDDHDFLGRCCKKQCCESCPTGPTGPSGGPIGPTGPTGAMTGPTGPSGGPTGPTGSLGPTGAFGGPTGPTGPTGGIGPTGTVSPQNYYQAVGNSSQSTSGSGFTIPTIYSGTPVVVGSGISYNSTTGVYSLSSAGVYQFQASLYFLGGTSGVNQLFWAGSASDNPPTSSDLLFGIDVPATTNTIQANCDGIRYFSTPVFLAPFVFSDNANVNAAYANLSLVVNQLS